MTDQSVIIAKNVSECFALQEDTTEPSCLIDIAGVILSLEYARTHGKIQGKRRHPNSGYQTGTEFGTIGLRDLRQMDVLRAQVSVLWLSALKIGTRGILKQVEITYSRTNGLPTLHIYRNSYFQVVERAQYHDNQALLHFIVPELDK